jgi:catechol 2,3-dioxygenase-like lactoylglutathione lyase family enzyme
MQIAAVSILVDDYDEAIAYYTDKLGFTLVEDRSLVPPKRWVRVAPSGGGAELLLARAATPRERARIGDQTGGRVFLFLRTDDFWRDYQRMRERGVSFLEKPRQEPYGIVAVFEDLYDNRWDLIEPS